MSYLSLGDKNDEDGGDLFSSPAGGSSSGRLGSLFGMSAQIDNSAGSNQSLTYTAPKPPKPGKQEQAEKTTPPPSGVAIVFAVTAYRYVDNQYKKQGKLGAALLRNFAERDFKILMYVSKQQPVTTAKITTQFQFNIQPNNYTSFYDDQRQMWSVLYDTADQVASFAKQVCLAKFNSVENANQVLSQDLNSCEQGQGLEAGDSVEVKYTGWLLNKHDGTLGTVFDSNHQTEKTFRFKVGKGKVIKGWDQGMIGMRKGGKRFLVIPAAYAYGTKAVQNKIPPNSVLAFEVDVLRIKFSKEQVTPNSNTVESIPKNPVQDRESAQPLPELPAVSAAAAGSMETVKGRTASFNELLEAGKATPDKAHLVSRMAKMGHAMLPHIPPNPTNQIPNSSAEVVTEKSDNPPHPQVNRDIARGHATPSPAYSGSPVSSGLEQSYMQNPHILYHRAMPNYAAIPQSGFEGPQANAAVGQFYPPQSATPFPGNFPTHQAPFNPMQQYPVVASNEFLPVILAESREQRSELKQLHEKVDKMTEKVEYIKNSSVDFREKSTLSQTSAMDGAMLAHNIQRIIQENERMRAQVLEKDKLIESQNDKIADLLQQNQRYVEDSHLLIEKRNASFKERFGQTQERTLQLEQEKASLISKLSDSNSKACDLQLKLDSAREHLSLLENRVKSTSNEALQKAEKDHAKYQSMAKQLSEVQLQLEKERSRTREIDLLVKEKVNEADSAAQDNLILVKQRFEEEKRKLIDEAKQLSEAHQKEVWILRSKAETSENVGNVKQDLENEWKMKCEDAVATVTKAAEERIQEANKDKEEISAKLEILKKKFLQLRGMYEEKVNIEEKMQQDNLGQKSLEENVKSIMNKVFQQVNSAISSKEEYQGSQVINIVLNIIKSTTLKLFAPDQDSDEEEEGEESEEEESEGEDDLSEPEKDSDSTEEVGKNDKSEKEIVVEERDVDEKKFTEDAGKADDQPQNLELGNQEEERAPQFVTYPPQQTSSGLGKNDSQAAAKKNTSEGADIDSKPESTGDGTGKDGLPHLQNPGAAENDMAPTEGGVGDNKKISADFKEERSISPDSPRPQPPPLFDDDDSDDDPNWLN